uniref:ATP synthase F0 subunit 8 n=1 Tax=Tambocerus sp. PY-2015 TaxID=1776878 RepID=A0A0U3TPT0_9HEMI|nr:ATP synthase F0 subunit 8 [Tambocerus sp. PY-2015]
MPQMAPMWWTFILMMTITGILLTISINYFMINKSLTSQIKHTKSFYNWMW